MKRALQNKKGFTLIEIIVVLVILAILAAAMIPSMLGFIEDSKGKAMVAEARTAYTAVQSIYTDITLSGGTVSNWDPTAEPPAADNNTAGDKLYRMLAPDVELTKTALSSGSSAKKVNVVVTMGEGTGSGKNGTEVGLVHQLQYKKVAGGKIYTVTLEPGKAATVSTVAAS